MHDGRLAAVKVRLVFCGRNVSDFVESWLSEFRVIFYLASAPVVVRLVDCYPFRLPLPPLRSSTVVSSSLCDPTSPTCALAA